LFQNLNGDSVSPVFSRPSKEYKIGDLLKVIVPHCDPVVNEFDQMYGIRKDKVEVVGTSARPIASAKRTDGSQFAAAVPLQRTSGRRGCRSTRPLNLVQRGWRMVTLRESPA
jgi:hypothetical protein